VEHGDDPDRPLLRRVRNEVFLTRDVESQWAGGQVRSSVSDVRGCRERGSCGVNISEDPVGSVDVVVSDVFPNLVEVSKRVGMNA
jgi:hypothetical protein